MNESLTSQGVGDKWEDHQNKADFLHKHKQLLMTLKLLFKLFTRKVGIIIKISKTLKFF